MNRVEQIERQLAKVFENLPKEYQYIGSSGDGFWYAYENDPL